MHLASGSLAAGPQFGRLLSQGGEPTAECTPRWNSLRSRLQAPRLGIYLNFFFDPLAAEKWLDLVLAWHNSKKVGVGFWSPCRVVAQSQVTPKRILFLSWCRTASGRGARARPSHERAPHEKSASPSGTMQRFGGLDLPLVPSIRRTHTGPAFEGA